MIYAPSRRFLLCLLAAVAIVIAHVVAAGNLRHPVLYDSHGYSTIADEIRAHGGMWFRYTTSDLRTYGYPWVIAHVFGFGSAVGNAKRWPVFEFQLALYIASAALLYAAAARHSQRAAAIACCGLLMNYGALVYSTEVLTESVSLSLIVIASACWLLWLADRRYAGGLWMFACGLAAGFACVVRPASVFLLPVLAMAIVLGAVWMSCSARERVLRGTAAFLIASVGMLLPLLPQKRHNQQFEATNRWLVASTLEDLQVQVGVRSVKYLTAAPPNPVPTVEYQNPCYDPFTAIPPRPLGWYTSHPTAGLCTLGLHVFALLDQDALFTYSTDLNPWYRRPLDAASHLVLFAGVWWLIATAFEAFKYRRSDWLWPAVSLVYIGCAIGLYAVTRIEVRFGLPAYLLLFVMAAFGACRLAGQSRRVQSRFAALAVAYVVAALIASEQIRKLAPILRNLS